MLLRVPECLDFLQVLCHLEGLPDLLDQAIHCLLEVQECL